MDLELDDTYDLGSDSLGPDLNADETSQVPPQTQQGVQDQPEVEEAGQDQAKKRVARPVFDASRLVSEDFGLPKLRKTLVKATFKHKGASRTDLKKLVAIYELWGHRLMPRSNPDDISQFLLRGGEDVNVKTYRKGLIDQDKYGDIEADNDQEDVVFSALADQQPTNSVSKNNNDASDSEFDIEEVSNAVAPINQEPTAIPDDEELEQMQRDDEWDVYRQLGF